MLIVAACQGGSSLALLHRWACAEITAQFLITSNAARQTPPPPFGAEDHSKAGFTFKTVRVTLFSPTGNTWFGSGEGVKPEWSAQDGEDLSAESTC